MNGSQLKQEQNEDQKRDVQTDSKKNWEKMAQDLRALKKVVKNVNQ